MGWEKGAYWWQQPLAPLSFLLSLPAVALCVRGHRLRETEWLSAGQLGLG